MSPGAAPASGGARAAPAAAPSGGPRRNAHQPALRDLHPAGSLFLAHLPGMRRTARAPLAPMRPLRAAATPRRASPRRHRHDSPPAAGPARQPGRQRPPRHGDELAEQEHRAAILRDLGAGERALTHAALDELADRKPIKHLRSVLVATGALPPRDEHWSGSNAGSSPPSPDAAIPASGSCCTATRSGIRCAGSGTATAAGRPPTARRRRQRHVRAAITLLDWLTARDLTLATARQGDLDTWLTSEHAASAARPGTSSAGQGDRS